MTIEMTIKERPILFSGPMVRAILEGRKTQTRRVVKQADMVMGLGDGPVWADAVYPARDRGWIAWKGLAKPGLALEAETKRLYSEGFPCPYGQPGDRLWVRETWWATTLTSVPEGKRTEAVAYAADIQGKSPARDGKWKPSIHMPRALSRITLEVIGVRVERVQSITSDDARAEGLSWVAPTWGVPGNADAWHSDPREAFRALWDSINEARGFGWAANPWVWVVEFGRVQL